MERVNISEEVSNDFDHDDAMSDEIEIRESQVPKPTGKRPRRESSGVWEEFTKVEKNGVNLAKCNKCGKEYTADSRKLGTSTLWRHVKSCPRRQTKDVGQMILAQSGGSCVTRQNKIDPDVFREMLSVAIIKHDLPFNFVEYEGIRDLHKYLNPDVKHITRNTAKADVLKLHKKHKEILREQLMSCPNRICLTSDLWSSITTDGYICLTAHFIDKDWILQKRILSFSAFPPPHTGERITTKVLSLLTEWGIEKKIFSITLDNASNNNVFARQLESQLRTLNALVGNGQFFHVRCCAHILNIIVQEGLKVLDEAIEKVRETVKYLKGSEARKLKFFECLTQLSLTKTKGIRQDVPTRWNSTFLMLESCLLYQSAFSYLSIVDSGYVTCPTKEEWEHIERISVFLKLFYDATNTFSGSKYPTSNLYFQGIWNIQMCLQTEKNSEDAFIRMLVERMQKKFDKYWQNYSSILSIGIVLDPRYKMQFLEFCFQKLYPETWIGRVEEVRIMMKSLFDEYFTRCNSSASADSSTSASAPQTQASGSESNIKKTCYDVQNYLQEFATFKSPRAQVSLSELELYLQEPKLDFNTELDILVYWRSHEYRYPILSKVARDVLTIPISTVASESAFSVGGRVLDQY